MAEAQPPTITEGATTGDVDDEIPAVAKSAEERKAAAALSSLDTPRDDESTSKNVDEEALRKVMERLGGGKAVNGTVAKKEEQKVVKKTVKVDAADVTLLVCSIAQATILQYYHSTTIQCCLLFALAPEKKTRSDAPSRRRASTPSPFPT